MENQNFIFDSVMIVDDTKIDRYIATHVMKKFGFAREVMEFDLATKAIEFIQANISCPELLPSIIILDIRMPVMDGFQFLEKLATFPQAVNQSCCIIMLSSSLDPVDHQRAEKSPVVKKFVNKPLRKEDLEEILKLYKTWLPQGSTPYCKII